jgi:hypothetical protein
VGRATTTRERSLNMARFYEYFSDFKRKKTICEARLDDGRIVEYDGCHEEGKDPAFYSNFEEIGHGWIFRINGREQLNQATRHVFYRKPKGA